MAAEAPAPATDSARLWQPVSVQQASRSRNRYTKPKLRPPARSVHPPGLVPEVYALAAAAHRFGLVVQEALEGGLACVGAARHVLQRRGEVERPQIRLGAEHLAPAGVQEHQRGHV